MVLKNVNVHYTAGRFNREVDICPNLVYHNTAILYFHTEMWLSLVERCVRDAEAAGSNPVISTNRKNPLNGFKISL